MREVSEREAGVCGRKLLVHEHGGDRIHAGAAGRLGYGDAEHAERTELAEQIDVERFGAVVRGGLRIDLALDEVADRAAQRRVLLGWVEEIGHGIPEPMRSTKLSQ